MVNVPKKIFSPVPAGKSGISTRRSIQRCHQANEGNSGLEAERVRAPEALRSLRSKNKLAAAKRRETHFLSHEEKDMRIEHYVEIETAGARKRVEDAEAVIWQEQEDIEAAENAGLRTRQPEETFHQLTVATGDSLSDMASSDDCDDGEDEDNEQTTQGQLSHDDKPGCVMGTITKTVQQRMERFRQKQMQHDELTQPGWEDTAGYFCERDMKYGTCELRVTAVVQPQTDDDAAVPALTTFGERKECLDIVPATSKMLQGTFRPGSSHMWLGSGKPQSNRSRPCLASATQPDSSLIQNAKPVELIHFNHCIEPPQLFTIWISDLSEEMVMAPVSAEE